jgi:hypothetical protein
MVQPKNLSFEPDCQLLQGQANNKCWRNNLMELGPSLSGFPDTFASFPSLVCQTNVLKHYPGIETSTFGVAVGDANH